MKRIKYLFALTAFTLICGSATAQNGFIFGMVTDAHSFTAADMLQFSQNSGSFNTARSSAMGGAFTSLGGDLVSIGLNPAGLGMYRSSAWGFSPSMTFTNTENDYKALSNSKNRFAFNNIGAVFNLHNNSRGLVSFNMGFSYNKVADFNFKTSATLPSGQYSINNIFELQLNGLYPFLSRGQWNGIYKGDLRNPFHSDSDISLSEWGAALAYMTGMHMPVADTDDNTAYRYVNQGSGAAITPTMLYNSRGSTGEYNISAGMNFNNVFYLGFGMALQNIYQEQTIAYSEKFDYSATGSTPLDSYINYMNYRQSVIVNGTGVNFKLGFVVRPIPALRIGVAVHSPTFMNLNHEYYSDMKAQFNRLANNTKSNSSYQNLYDYDYNTPTRLMAGISYTFSNFAVLSFDYEKTFYNGMRLKNASRDEMDYYRDEIKNTYRAADAFKAGLEVKPTPTISLRAGYSHYTSPFKSDDIDISSRFVATKLQNISAGIGFRLGRRTTLDLAYIYSLSNYNLIDLYSYSGEGRLYDAAGNPYTEYYFSNPSAPDEKPIIEPSNLISGIKQKRHTVTLSLNFQF